jgi:hypothetical protein
LTALPSPPLDKLPSPEQLKYKVLVKGKRLDSPPIEDDPEDDEGQGEIFFQYSVIFVIQNPIV